jgi:hypothetical protein
MNDAAFRDCIARMTPEQIKVCAFLYWKGIYAASTKGAQWAADAINAGDALFARDIYPGETGR